MAADVLAKDAKTRDSKKSIYNVPYYLAQSQSGEMLRLQRMIIGILLVLCTAFESVLIMLIIVLHLIFQF